MNLVRFLPRSSRGIVSSRRRRATGGAAGVALIALIQAELCASVRPAPWPGPSPGSASRRPRRGSSARSAWSGWGRGRSRELACTSSGASSRCPCAQFESIDTSALLAVLTEDIVLIANALVGVPHLCINMPIVIACLAYIGWLSPAILACGVVFAALAIAAYVVLSSRGDRGAPTGAGPAGRPGRPLPHPDRRVPRAEAAPRPPRGVPRRALEPDHGLACAATWSAASADFAVAEGWGQLAFFGFIGLLLFVVPRLEPIGLPTLVSAVLVVLYLMTPLDVSSPGCRSWAGRGPRCSRSSPCSPRSNGTVTRPRAGRPRRGRCAPRLGRPRGRDVRLSRRHDDAASCSARST